MRSMAKRPSVAFGSGVSSETVTNIWRLKDDCESSKKTCMSDVELIHLPFSLNPSLSGSNLGDFISPRAVAGLSKAAKKTVLDQQRVLMQDDPRYQRRIKSQNMRRLQKRQHATAAALALRPEVVSAPPTLGHGKNDAFVMYKDPPKIVVISASQQSEIAESLRIKSPPNQQALTVEEVQADDTPRTTMSYGSYANTDLFTPDFKSPDSFYKAPSETPRSATNFTDWAWVRERLASRESTMARPESALTFDDFLNGLDPDSDEYDTDLEDNFIKFNIEAEDRTGVSRYRKICEIKGITPAKQVVNKLSNECVNFTLKHRNLNSKDTFALSGALVENTSVEKLNLSGNSIDDQGAENVLSMLKKNSTIRRLDLSNNCLKGAGGSEVSDMLRKNSTLTHISISQNRLGDNEALLLSEVLRYNKTLLALNVSQNKFSDLAGQSFAAALMDNDALTSLNLSWNSLGKLSASALGKALKVNTALNSLDLSYNGVGDEGAALLAKPLRHNTTLKQLSLAVNHIGPFGVERLATGVCGNRGKKGKKSNCSLRSLILDRNPLGRKGVIAFIKHMEVTDKLIDLSIKEVVLTTEVMSMIRQLTSFRSVSVFFEGQREDEQNESAIQCGAVFLRQILEKNRMQLNDFFNSLDPKKEGLKMKQLKRALQKLKFPPSELELQRLLQNLNIKRNNLIRYKDICRYTMDDVAVKVTKESKPKRRIAFRF